MNVYKYICIYVSIFLFTLTRGSVLKTDPRVKVNKRTKGEGARCDAQRPREHHSNHDADAWSIQMSNEEEPAPSAPRSEKKKTDLW